jgi:hypothetical protein
LVAGTQASPTCKGFKTPQGVTPEWSSSAAICFGPAGRA